MDIKPNDRVSVKIDGEVEEGVVKLVRPSSQVVKVSVSGAVKTFRFDEVTVLRRGFKQYEIIWKPGEKGSKNVNFRFFVPHAGEKIEFHGWWRRSEIRAVDGRATECFCVDIFCKWAGKSYSLKTIPYFTDDPRDDMPSLSADITAAANEFIWKQLHGKMSALDNLSEMAAQPIIRIKNMRTLDALISKLMEHRAASIGVGGPRHCDIQSDEPGGPRVVFAIDLTLQHIALEGRVPSLIEGAVYDSVGKKGKSDASGKLVVKIDDSNLQSLVAQLQQAKERGDSTTARKIRATLRKLGHKGGARSAAKVLKK